MFQIHMRQYIKSPKLGLINLLGFAGVWFYLFRFTDATEITEMIGYSMHPVKFLFFLYLFLSYEFFCMEKQASLEEIVDSTYCGRGKCECAKFFIFFISILGEAGIIYRYYWTGLERFVCNTEETRAYFLMVVAIYHFAVCFLAVLLGWGASFCKKRISGYGVLVLVSYLFTRNFIMILQLASKKTELYYKIADIFCIFERDYFATTNYYYLLSTEFVEIQRLMVWFLAGLSILVWKKLKGKKKIAVVLPVILLGCVFYCYWQPTAAVHADKGANGHDAWTKDFAYYKHRGQEKKYKDAEEFQVKGYTMKLEANRILEAQVVVEVDKTDVKEYVFTLYHDYKIDTIVNQDGEPMDFVQAEDCVVVYNNGQVQKLQFTYKGLCKNYYATSHGMYLPAYFAYYPMAGERKIYKKLTAQDDESWILYEGYNLECLKEEVEFDVTVLGDQTIYCNLEEVESNHFKGTSDGLTLLSGRFIETIEIEDSLVIYSYLDWDNPKKDINVKQELQQWIEGNQQIKGKTIFIAPLGNYDSYTFASDHVIGRVGILNEYYDRYLKTGSLYELEE